MNRRKQVLREFGRIEGLKRLSPKPRRKLDPIGEGKREGLKMLRDLHSAGEKGKNIKDES